MATWQADFDLQLPVEGIAAEFVEELRRILPSTRSWSTKLQVFGEADGHRVDVWSEGGKIIEISMRIDLRHPDRSLFERVLGCLRDAGCSLRALPSRDLVRAAHQQVTAEWWTNRAAFELFISQAVLAEARRGDPSAIARRLVALVGLEVLSATPEAQVLAGALLAAAALPSKAAIDAAHVAIAAVHGINFLVTWNCAHIANALMRPRIERVCRDNGFEPPTICTPEELHQKKEDA